MSRHLLVSLFGLFAAPLILVSVPVVAQAGEVLNFPSRDVGAEDGDAEAFANRMADQYGEDIWQHKVQDSRVTLGGPRR